MKTGLRGSRVTKDLRWVRCLATPCTALCALFVFGCATANQRCDYYADGRLEHYRLRSTVVGTGETELITTDCAALGYSTRETGLSDNGTAALGEISEGAVRALLPLP